jgi:undecaprenyl diphosphate synthase
MTVAHVKHSDEIAAPLHVAIIMDGNGRWATARNLPRTAGHQRGADSVKTAIKSAVEMGVSYLTLYGFSQENWNRPEAEVNDLMGLLRFHLRGEIKYLSEKGVRFRAIGDRERLAPDIVTLIEDVEESTASNTRLSLTVALSYGGRSEISHAARQLAQQVKDGTLEPEDISETLFEQNLYTADIPDPDLLIRTSGEQRISNFLLWQLAYAEFVFIDKHWPDFSKEDFESAVREFQARDRRYGTTSS